MSADKHPADVLALWLDGAYEGDAQDAALMLRRIPALEAERDVLAKHLALQELHQIDFFLQHHEPLETERDQLRIEVGRLQECVRLLTERSDRDNAERDQLRAEVQRWSVLAASFEAERNLLREEISDLHKANAARKQQ